jgi:predicted DNA-binding transcriptional regulator AlpA
VSTEPASPALVYTRADFALALGMGLRTFDRLRVSDPTFPAPIRFAGPNDRPKWYRVEAQAWLEATIKRQREEQGAEQ